MNFRPGTECPHLGTFNWERSLRNVRLGNFASELSLMDLCLGMFAWESQLGYFRLGASLVNGSLRYI